MRKRSSAQAARSSTRQRSEQKGRCGFPSHGVSRRHVGQRTERTTGPSLAARAPRCQARLIRVRPSRSSPRGGSAPLPGGVPSRAGAPYARLAHAAGGPLHARVPRRARAPRLPGALQVARRGGGGGRDRRTPPRRRCGDHLRRHPPRARADGRGARVHARRWPRDPPPRALRCGRGPPGRGRSGGARLRRRGGRARAGDAPGARAAHRLCRRPLHARLVSRRGRRLAHLRAHQGAHDRRWRVARAHGAPRARRGRLPERADRRGCRRGAALRQLGRLPLARRLPRPRAAARARLDRRARARHAGDPLRHRDGGAPRGDARRGRPRDRPRLARRPRRGVGTPRPRRRGAGEPRPERPAGAHFGDPCARRRHPRPGGESPGPHLQPGPRHPARDPGRPRARAGRRRARAVGAALARSRSMAADAVLLIAFGGPTRAEEVRPFLANVLRGRPVPPERVEEVVRHYEAIGGRSPLRDLTFRQARQLEATLAAGGPVLPVYVGMRSWEPYLADTLARMAADGRRRAVAVILSPHASEASRERYMEEVGAASAALGPRAPEVRYAGAWHTHPLFVTAVADAATAALVTLPAARRAAAVLVFTAHSVPVAMAARSPYVAEVTASVRAVAEQIGRTRWQVAYQSRSGGRPESWLEPDVNEAP